MTDRIRAMVGTILDRCAESDQPPHAIVSEALRELKADPTWSESDRALVEATVLRILKASSP
jgi:hypothetical protein